MKFSFSKKVQPQKIERTASDYAVEIKNLVVEYRTSKSTVQAVNGIDLTLKKKHTIGLVGETGAGKTTSMLALMGLVPNPPGVIVEGSILVNGIDMRSLSPAQLSAVRGSEIAMIFQDPMTSLNPVLSVGEQIQESILFHENISKKEAWERARQVLATVGIDPNRAGEYPHQFSGGMRQRVGIAIALACHPSVLIADEPTTALDVSVQAEILTLLKKLNRESGMAIMLISHDLHVVRKLCSRVAVMQRGKLVEDRPVEEIFRNPQHPYTRQLIAAIPGRDRHLF